MSRSISKDIRTDARQSFWLRMNASRPDGTLSRDGRFKWSAGWNRWVPTGQEQELELPGPLEFGPLLPERHSSSCGCASCWNIGVRYNDYLKAKAVRERNGF
jgi:hypothetical protein